MMMHRSNLKSNGSLLTCTGKVARKLWLLMSIMSKPQTMMGRMPESKKNSKLLCRGRKEASWRDRPPASEVWSYQKSHHMRELTCIGGVVRRMRSLPFYLEGD